MNAPGMPAIGPLSAPSTFAPSPLAGLLQAVGQAPQIAQAQQAQTEQYHLQSAQTDAAITQAEDQRLGQIAQYAQTNPGFARDPRVQATVASIFKRRNLPAPVNSDGTLDVATLAAATRPPLPPGAQSELLRVVNQQIANIADPKGGGPEAFAAFLKSFGPMYARAFGVDPSSMLDDPQVRQALDVRAQTETDKLVELGIVHPQDEDRYHQQFLDASMEKFRESLGEKTRVDDSLIARRSAQTQAENAKVVIAQQKLPAQLQLLSSQAQHYATMGTAGVGKIPPAATAFLTNYRSTRAAYQSNVARIKQIGATEASKPIAPGQPSLVDTTIALKQQLDASQDTFDTLSAALNHAGANAAQAITGAKVVPTKTDDKVVGETYVDGKGHKAKYLGNGKWQSLP